MLNSPGFQQSVRDSIPGWDGLLFVYGVCLLPVVFSWLLGLNILAWAHSRINYIFIFGKHIYRMICPPADQNPRVRHTDPTGSSRIFWSRFFCFTRPFPVLKLVDSESLTISTLLRILALIFSDRRSLHIANRLACGVAGLFGGGDV